MSLNCKNLRFTVSLRSRCKKKLAGSFNVVVISLACIQQSYDSEPTWLEGGVSISRSPVAHPGDGRFIVLPVYDHDHRYVPTVQRVRAIGKPPAGMFCLFSHLKNVVVLPSVGTSKFPVSVVWISLFLSGPRSLASCLGGGDVDG